MKNDWNEDEDLLTAGAICPMPGCGAVNLTYCYEDENQRSAIELCEFTCSRCGVDFIAAEHDLLFHSVPRQWFLAGSYSA